MDTLKQKLYEACLIYVQQTINAAESGIKEAQQAAQDDTKSSAGDKYETGREMMQQETNRNLAQLHAANKLKVAMDRIPVSETNIIDNGSIVITNAGNFYLAISAGSFNVDGNTYTAISLASPIGQKMKGLSRGDIFEVNGRRYTITKVM